MSDHIQQVPTVSGWRSFRATIFVSLLLAGSGASLHAQVSQSWVARFPAFSPAAMVTDSKGNTYVTGTQCDQSGVCSSLTVKYDSAGHDVWEASQRPVNEAKGIDIALDAQENIYVLSDVYRSGGPGVATLTGDEFAVSKYSPDSNTRLWLKLFTVSADPNEIDIPVKLAVAGNVYVTGTSTSVTGTSAVIVKYDLSGNQAWSKLLPVTAPPPPTAVVIAISGLALDGAENVYVAVDDERSNQDHDASIYKHDTDGNLLAQFGKDKLGTIAAMKVEPSGRVYIAGGGSPQPPGGAEDPVVATFGTTGSLIWLHDFGPPATGIRGGPYAPNFVGLATDAAGNVFAAKDARPVTVPKSISVVKLAAADGALQWQSNYNGHADGSGDDYAVALAANSTGDVYVTGISGDPTVPCCGPPQDIATIKYDGAGNQGWVQRYSSGVSEFDNPVAIGLGTDGRIMVTGTAAAANSSADGVTIAYTETPRSPMITISPTTLTFSGAVGSTTAAQTVTVDNKSTVSAGLTAAPVISGTNAGDFAIANSSTCLNGTAISPGNSCKIDVTFKAGAAGSRSASLVIQDSDPSSPQSVSLAGTGANPAGPVLTFSPGSLTFPPEPIGTTTPAQTVTLSNTGGTVLNVSLITFGGANPGDFKGDMTCGKTLAPGTGCTANITFTPTDKGTRTAVFSVSDDEPGSPQTVSLTGKGSGIALTCAQSALTITAGQTATFNVNVSPTAFDGAVALACSGAPAGATCAVNPPSVTVSGDTPMPLTVTVTTKAHSVVLLRFPRFRFDRMMWITLALALSMLFFLAWSFSWRWKTSLALLALLALSFVGCAGTTASSGMNPTPTPTPTGGTPAGTSTLVLNATSGSAKATLPLTLTVN